MFAILLIIFTVGKNGSNSQIFVTGWHVLLQSISLLCHYSALSVFPPVSEHTSYITEYLLKETKKLKTYCGLLKLPFVETDSLHQNIVSDRYLCKIKQGKIRNEKLLLSPS